MESRADLFERQMNKLPNVLVDIISEYINPECKDEYIANSHSWSPHYETRYNDLTDSRRYNDLPGYQKDLALKIWTYGDF